MGIYIFNTDVLIPVLLKDAEDLNSSHDFGKDILPRMLGDYRVFAFNFVDENKKEALYWRDVARSKPTTKPTWIWFRSLRSSISTMRLGRFAPPAPVSTGEVRVSDTDRMGRALDSLVSSGCIISGGSVQNCVLSPNVRVNSYSEIENSILFSHVNVGRSCRIRKAIIDRDVHIPKARPSATMPMPTASATSSPTAASRS